MIRWMLARLEQAPSAVFYEKELRHRFPEGFDRARRERLLRHVEAKLDGGFYRHGLNRRHVVVVDGGNIEAIDDEDPEADPIELTLADLAVWSLDLKALARRFQQANGLKGKPGALDERLFFLGEGDRNGLKLAFVLGLFSEPRSARPLLAALPELLPTRYGRVAVVCPTFTLEPAELRSLELTRVSLVALGEPDLFLLGRALVAQTGGNVFRREADYWMIGYQGSTVRLRDSKGFRYIHQLLRHPGRPFPALELVALVEHGSDARRDAVSKRALAEDGLTVPAADADAPILDARAKDEYRRRLAEIEAEIEDADASNDPERASGAREAKDHLVAELAGAVGLGGRDRRTVSNAERARVNVTKQVRKSISRIAKEDAPLAQFLDNAIGTGALCSYTPDRPVTWDL